MTLKTEIKFNSRLCEFHNRRLSQANALHDISGENLLQKECEGTLNDRNNREFTWLDVINVKMNVTAQKWVLQTLLALSGDRRL